MARLDVYVNPMAERRREVPYWIDVQSEFLAHLGTRVVVPLCRVRPKTNRVERLNPVFTVEAVDVFMDTSNIATFPAHRLTRRAANLAAHRFDIDNALDFLFQGL